MKHGKKLAMSQISKLGLVTVLYNSPDVIDDFFYSLSCQAYTDYHLYLVDNSSISEPLDKSKLLAAKYNIPVTFIDNEGANVGVAAGNNQGIKAALSDGCECIGLINNDLIFEQPMTLSNLILSMNDKYDFVSPKILAYPDGDIWFDGGYFDLLKGTTPHINKNSVSSVIPYAPTCFLICKAEVFAVCGLMDEWYFAYYDDSDFVFRLNNSGFKLGFINDVVIKHKVSSSTGGLYSDFSLYYGNRNRIYFIRKNLKSITCLLFTVFSRVVLLPHIKLKQYPLLIKSIYHGFKTKIK